MISLIDVVVPDAGGSATPPPQLAALPGWLMYAIVIAALVGGMVVVGVVAYRRLRDENEVAEPVEEDDTEWGLPPLIVPPGLYEGASVRPPTALFQRPATPPKPAVHAARNGGTRPDPGTPAAADQVGPARTDGTAVHLVDARPGTVDVGPVRFHRPPEGTLQLLPGRLEILAGKEQVEEIRFVKIPGRDAIVTFGRNEGEPHVHVQLHSATVSRMHAVMRFHQGRWHISNLSRTNPVLVRGFELPPQADDAVQLEDGDEVEMGEVIFRFRQR